MQKIIDEIDLYHIGVAHLGVKTGVRVHSIFGRIKDD